MFLVQTIFQHLQGLSFMEITVILTVVSLGLTTIGMVIGGYYYTKQSIQQNIDGVKNELLTLRTNDLAHIEGSLREIRGYIISNKKGE